MGWLVILVVKCMWLVGCQLNENFCFCREEVEAGETTDGSWSEVDEENGGEIDEETVEERTV